MRRALSPQLQVLLSQEIYRELHILSINTQLGERQEKLNIFGYLLSVAVFFFYTFLCHVSRISLHHQNILLSISIWIWGKIYVKKTNTIHNKS